MGNLGSALQQLRAERKQAQSHVEKLDQAINGTDLPANRPKTRDN